MITDKEIKLWPNPNDGTLVNIALRGFDIPDDGLAHITVLDGVGRQVHQSTLALASDRNTGLLALPNDLAPGIYMVEVQVGEQRITDRLVLQR